jgi:predicted ATPase
MNLKPQFIGRQNQMLALKNAVDDAISSKGRIVMISGEAGIGKTRLVEEIFEYCKTEGMIVLTGKCFFREGGDPYLPFVEAINDYVRQSRAQEEDVNIPAGLGSMISHETSRDIIPMGLMGMGIEGNETVEEETPTSAVDFTLERDRMFETVFNFFSNISKKQPLIFFLDDLHWADSATLQLLYYLARSIREARVLFVGAYRPEEIETLGETHPLTEAIQRMTRENLVVKIQLKRLSVEETQAVIDSMFERRMPKKMAELLYKETEGNPYFIEEVVKSLVDSGVVDGDAAEGDIDISGVKIPSSVTDLISRRIEQLDEETRKVLDYSSVVGNEFNYYVLLKTTGMDEEELVEGLDKLMDLKLVSEDPSGGGENYGFTHNMTREVVYRNLSRAKRRLMHKKVGKSLEEIYKGREDAVCYALAYHFTQAADMGRALDYSLTSGEKAMSIFAFDEAQNYYRKALEGIGMVEVDETTAGKEVLILNRLGEIASIQGDWRGALRNHYEAIRLCEGEDLDLQQSLAYRMVGKIEMQRSEWKIAIESFERALKISERIKDHRGLADAFSGLAWISWKVGDHEKTLIYSNRAIENAKRIKNESLVAKAYIDIGNSYNELLSNYDMALEYYENALRILERDKTDMEQLPRAYNNIGDVYMKLEQFEKAIDYFKKVLDITEKTGDIKLKAFGTSNVGECLSRMGEFDEAKPYIDEALKMFEKVDNRYMISQMYHIYGVCAKGKEQWDEAIRNFDIALKIQEEHNLPWALAMTNLEYGIVLKAKGEKEKAIPMLEKALAIFQRLGSDTYVEVTKMELEED